jgi:hypothetical protein
VLQLADGAVEIVADFLVLGGELVAEPVAEIAFRHPLETRAERFDDAGDLRGGFRARLLVALPLLVGRALLLLRGALLLGGLLLCRLERECVVFEDLDRLRHDADFVAALLALDLRRQVALGKDFHVVAKPDERLGDFGKCDPQPQNHANREP